MFELRHAYVRNYLYVHTYITNFASQNCIAKAETTAYVAAKIFHNIFVPFGIMHSTDAGLYSQNSLTKLSFAAYEPHGCIILKYTQAALL